MSKQSVRSLQNIKNQGEKLTWVTCYDYSFASALNETDIDLILVGDSGGMTMLGYSDTHPVTMEEMIHLCKSVRRGAPDKFIVGDMPKGSYEGDPVCALQNAMRFVKEAGCDAVKLEGAGHMVEAVRIISNSGIPVIGHLGLTPQSSSQFGGYRVVGRSDSEANKLMSDTLNLANAGVFAILFEALPGELSARLSNEFKELIKFGIGAGKDVDGQLLILHDLLGLYPNFRPKFAKCFIPQVIDAFSRELQQCGNLIDYGKETRSDGFRRLTILAISAYIAEVRTGRFPDDTYSYK